MTRQKAYAVRNRMVKDYNVFVTIVQIEGEFYLSLYPTAYGDILPGVNI